MVERHPMTLKSHKLLQEKLHHLKSFERPRIVKAIEEARAHGDLSENAEYDAAKNEQGLLETKINQIELRLSTAQVVDVSKLSGSKVVFGATVLIRDLDSEEEKKIKIVGEDEADANSGLISYKSPLARSLIGKEVYDVINVRLPSGKKEYEIVEVEFLAGE